ncbi:hypothetical protein AVEN_197345-1 [Araneus ventricosus]|uniref:Uncharacterized protein n=1 Tax=Araneus ventricosus TaxID=182803 RepID=A0A4Y2RS12_ARAVE|nr:hypothetical protein AVEN_197345-1 [Araneus ventricosus]
MKTGIFNFSSQRRKFMYVSMTPNFGLIPKVSLYNRNWRLSITQHCKNLVQLDGKKCKITNGPESAVFRPSSSTIKSEPSRQCLRMPLSPVETTLSRLA